MVGCVVLDSIMERGHAIGVLRWETLSSSSLNSQVTGVKSVTDHLLILRLRG
jgi:hypothetical protein